MATIKIRIPESKHERLRQLAQAQGVSVNKLVKGWAGIALAQFDAETRFRTRAAQGNANRGLAHLDKLDRVCSPPSKSPKKSRRRRWGKAERGRQKDCHE